MDIFVENPWSNYMISNNLCKFLTTAELKSLSLVSKEWEGVTNRHISKQCLFNVDEDNVSGVLELAAYSRRYDTFKFYDISLNNFNTILSRLLDTQFRDIKNNLQRINLKEMFLANITLSEGSLKMLKLLEPIKKLTIYDCTMNFEHLEDLNLSIGLEKLLITMTHPKEYLLCKKLLLENNQTLTKIKLGEDEDHVIEDSVDEIMAIEAASYPNLETIHLNDEYIDFEQFFRLNPQLKSFRLHDCMIDSRKIVSNLQNFCPDVKKLSIERCESDEDEIVDIHCSDKLTVLKITGTMQVNILNKNFKNLKTFDNDNVSPEILLPLLRNMANLTSLNLLAYQDNFTVTSELLYAISKSCPKLEHLLLARNPGINVNCDKYKFKPFRNLVLLNLSFCELNDDVFMRLSFPRLVNIRLYGSHLTDKGLAYLALNCPFLEEVHISNSDFITDKGVTYLFTELRLLRVIKAEFCRQLTASISDAIVSKFLPIDLYL